MMTIFEMLVALNETHGPSGHEDQTRAKIQELVSPYVDECYTDTLGNLVAHKKGTGPKVMFAAHMDSIGMIVTHIEKDGLLRFAQLGSLPASRIVETLVRFENGRYGLISADEETKDKLKVTDLVIDIGAKDEDDAKQLVKIGDTAVYASPTVEAGSRIISPYHDDRTACVILIKALEMIEKTENDLYFVFTVQEEVGTRGAKTAAYAIDPDYGIAVDVTSTGDIFNEKKYATAKMGEGAAVKIMDRSIICHPKMVELLEATADKHQIKHQRDILTVGGTDAGPIHLIRSGVVTGGISIPARYIHSPTEMADVEDIQACIDLVAAFSEAELPTV